MLDVLFVFEANVIQQLRIGRNDLLNLDGPRNFSVILPFLLALSGNAVAAGAQGQLEMGASYYVANNKSRNAAMPFAKQGFRAGRFEFLDGSEAAPKNARLAASIG